MTELTADSCSTQGMCKNIVQKASLAKPLIIYNRTTARATALADSLGANKTKVATTVADAGDGGRRRAARGHRLHLPGR